MLAAQQLQHAPNPAALAAFAQRYAGESIIVCGCGPSLTDLSGRLTIGVNDVGRLFTPTYLVVVNPPRQFRGDRFEHVRRSRASALFTHLDLGPVDPPVVRFRLGRYGGTDIDPDGDTLHYTQNSPYVAVCLAACMGARRIGLIGVDFTEHHFFGATGRHPLAARLATIDREYAALAAALAARGVELVNLSPVSRLQSLPRMKLDDFDGRTGALPVVRPAEPAVEPRRRVFVVNYRFVTCGDVFADGLRHAAQALGVEHAEAAWDDPRLPQLVQRFDPDLLLVVHGRRFAQRWGDAVRARCRAVWLVDEPYEVDDTAAWSQRFDLVFLNDAATLARHRHAHLLPMAYDPVLYRDPGGPRPHRVAFIGGSNATRERFLLPLATAGQLDVLVGGPWRAQALRRLNRALHLPHGEVARLYQGTQIVINVFRDQHHFNAAGTAGQAPNPRVFEALACGALVASERRAGIDALFPELPQFDTPEALRALVARLLAEPAERERLRAACAARLEGHSYASRLRQALALVPAAPAAAGVQAALPAAPLPAAALASRSTLPTARTPLDLAPLPGTPRRHLLYHLWPVRGSTWRWNVRQLLERVDLFNGRRCVAVALDERCEALDEVHAAFAGHGFETIELANDPRGEAASFPQLLARVWDEPGDEVVFYAHAKGVKYEPAFPPAVMRWAELQYAVLLDDWLAVREQLDRFAMTGVLRRLGRFANHGHVGDWHYSGTFFWFRLGAVRARGGMEVPQFYGGVEAWPGVLFSRHETGCLLLDHLRDLPYRERFWAASGGPAFASWQRRRRAPPAPAELLHPPPFEGHAGPRLEQRGDEFAWWLDTLQAERVRRLLIIGPAHAGEAWHSARRLDAPGVEIDWLSPQPAREADRALADAAGRFAARIRLIEQREAAAPAYDAVFIDGEHGWRAARADLDFALARAPRIVGLHDIVDSDWHAHARCAVSRVWQALERAHRSEARNSSPHWAGIGLLRPGC